MDARCAKHPELHAVGTCERCGDFYCNACGDGRHEGVCVRCGALRPHGLPWEDRRYGFWPRRFIATLRDLVVRPMIAFPGPPRVRPSLVFATICGLTIGAVWAASGAAVLLQRPHPLIPSAALIGGSLLLVPLVAIALLLFALVNAASFAAGLASMGRRLGALRSAVRASAYAQGLTLLASVPVLVAALVVLKTDNDALLEGLQYATLPVSVLWFVGTVRIAYSAARGSGLDPGRASAAAVGPVALSFALIILLADVQLDVWLR